MSPIITIDTDNAVIRLYLDAVRAAGLSEDGVARLRLDVAAVATAMSYLSGCAFRVMPIVASEKCRREPRPVGDDPEIEDGIRPWDRATCSLVGIGRHLALESLRQGERLCDRCWGDRPKCGGYPRKDGRR